jgi:hypothetical protein
MGFRKLLAGLGQGEVVIPVIRAALFNPDFKDFTVKVRGFEKRDPDGWFHPSEHPLWEPRQLFFYLVEPERLRFEPFDLHSVMAVTQGQFWHSFIERVGTDCGLFTGVEVKFEDAETGARGSMDATLPEEGFEFKTARPNKFREMPKGPPDDKELLEWFKGYWPTYYAQGQEYMRLSGYRLHRMLFLCMDYPYEMREILVPFDHFFSEEIAEKYRMVRQAVADQRMPGFCCFPNSKLAKVCVARLVCPVGSGG